MTTMVQVRIVGLQVDPASRTPVVLLAETPLPTRVLPILIGPAEAQSIALAVTGVVPPRPGTHDVMVSLLDKTDSRLEEVAITELSDGVFFAELFIETPTGLHRVGCRPSDGLALAVRVDVPIVVNPAVLDAAAVAVQRGDEESFSDEEIDAIVDEFHKALETVTPSDFDPGADPEESTPTDPDDRTDPGTSP